MKTLKNLSLLTVLGLAMSTSAFADVNTFAATKGQVAINNAPAMVATSNKEIKYLTSVDPKKETHKSLRERETSNRNDR